MAQYLVPARVEAVGIIVAVKLVGLEATVAMGARGALFGAIAKDAGAALTSSHWLAAHRRTLPVATVTYDGLAVNQPLSGPWPPVQALVPLEGAVSCDSLRHHFVAAGV
jgi:hypothetical protein